MTHEAWTRGAPGTSGGTNLHRGGSGRAEGDAVRHDRKEHGTVDERPEDTQHANGVDDDGLWSEALWSAGLIGSVLAAIAALAMLSRFA